jgi:hypothetical protein
MANQQTQKRANSILSMTEPGARSLLGKKRCEPLLGMNAVYARKAESGEILGLDLHFHR